MSYVKNEWKRGDIVTAEKLNHMEDGIANGWPADLPKPSVGGYGYTEQGEQTVITWDGDTEGRDRATFFGITYYKVSEITDAPNSATISVSGVSIESEKENGENVSIFVGGEIPAVLFVTENTFSVDGMEGSADSAGIYFIKYVGEGQQFVVSSLTYGTPDTIHKIDEKYLPEAGGGGNDFVIELQSDYTLNSENLAICNQYVDFYKNGGANKPHSVTVLHKGNEYKVIGTNVYGSEGFAFEAVNFAPTVSSTLEHTDVKVIAFDCYVPEREWTIVRASYTLP